MQTGLYMDVSPPVHGEIYTFAHSATAARYEVPPQWVDQMVTICNAGTATLSVAFGDAGVKIGSDEYAVVLGETITPNMASGFKVGPGQVCSVPVASNCTHFCVDSDTTGGDWSVYRSSGSPLMEEALDHTLGTPLLHLDASKRSTITGSAVT